MKTIGTLFVLVCLPLFAACASEAHAPATDPVMPTVTNPETPGADMTTVGTTDVDGGTIVLMPDLAANDMVVTGTPDLATPAPDLALPASDLATAAPDMASCLGKCANDNSPCNSTKECAGQCQFMPGQSCHYHGTYYECPSACSNDQTVLCSSDSNCGSSGQCYSNPCINMAECIKPAGC